MTNENPKTKFVRIGLIATLALLIAVPVLCMNHEQGVISDIDNRKLQDLPTLDAEATLAHQIENYFSDRIGFRKEMIGAYPVLNDKAFHLMAHPTYEYGTDGYVFFKFEEETYDYNHVLAYADYVAYVQDYCLSRDIPFLYVISPEKSRVYPEYVPDSVGQIPYSTDVLKPLLEERGVHYIDLADALFAAKDEGKQVFNKVYDAGHWNSEGMYAGSQIIVDELQDMGFDLEDINLNDYIKNYTDQTSLPVSFYPINETTFMYEIDPNISYADEFQDDYIVNLELDKTYHTCWRYHSDLENDVDLLMFQGSYFNTQGEMLQNEVSTLSTIHDYRNIFAQPYFIDIYQPDVVIFENADYTVTESYYPHQYLTETVLPQSYSTYASYPITSLDASVLVAIDPEHVITTLHTAWPSDVSIDALYINIDGVIYDTIAEPDMMFKWGVMSDTFTNAQSVTFIGVDTQSHQQYLISYK